MNPFETTSSASPTRRGPELNRRRVIQAAAWSVPAITVATAAPAFAASPGADPVDPVTFTSGMFWRPEAAEIADPEEAQLWGIMPSASIIWISQITNVGAAPASVSLELAAPPVASGFFAAKGFRVLDASVDGNPIAVTPGVSIFTDNGTRSADGRVVVTLPEVPVTTPATVTVVIQKPESVTRGASPSWNVTITPPGTESTVAVPITSYADFLGAIT